MSTPFAFCLRCRVSYEQVRGNDFAKLATLDQEGRSSAVTILSSSIVRSLRGFDDTQLDPKARKLLTFVDNRQDASLQAGHFNDFVQVTPAARGAAQRPARAAARRADPRASVGAGRHRRARPGPVRDFAANPQAQFSQKEQAERALRQVVEYRLYTDLQRGWRVTMPNLEQVGLLHVRYVDLPEIAARTRHGNRRPSSVGAAPELREELAAILLDELRRVLAIDVDCLTEDSASSGRTRVPSTPDRPVGDRRGERIELGRHRVPAAANPAAAHRSQHVRPGSVRPLPAQRRRVLGRATYDPGGRPRGHPRSASPSWTRSACSPRS